MWCVGVWGWLVRRFGVFFGNVIYLFVFSSWLLVINGRAFHVRGLSMETLRIVLHVEVFAHFEEWGEKRKGLDGFE